MSATMNGAYIKYMYVSDVIPEITEDLDLCILEYYDIAYSELTTFLSELNYNQFSETFNKELTMY